MLDLGKLKNIAVFMERVQVTGKEALAWAQTYDAVIAAINAIESPPAAPPVPPS